MFFTRRQFRLVAWSIANLQNWPSAIAGRLWRRPVDQIRFRNGIRFKVDVNAGDLQCIYEVFGDRFYDRHFHGIAPDGTILDIGGNIGTFTVRAARDLVPRGKVIAVEPNPQCLAAIEQHLRMNHLDNVQLVQAAVTNEGDRILLHVGKILGDSTLFGDRNGEAPETISVPTLSTTDVLRLADSYELVKIDCEGGEFALLYETEPEDWKNTKRISLEYHIGFDKKYPVSPEQLGRRIEELGFKVLVMRPGSEQFGYIVAARGSIE